RAGAGGVPGAARADLLARLRRPREGGPRDQRPRAERGRAGARRDRSRPPRLRLRRVAVPRDRVDARRLRRDRGLADPERARERRRGGDVGERPPRRRCRHRQRDPRRHGRSRRRHRRRGGAPRARPDDRPGNRGHAARRRRLPRGRRGGAVARAQPAVRPVTAAVRARRLLRDLAQVATPAGDGAPLRGAALGDVTVLEDAYVLWDGDRIDEVGRMADLPVLTDDVEEVDGRGLCAIPGLVDCHTHAAFGGDRVEEFALRAAGAGYEELHARGGGILSTVRATRAAGADGLRAAVGRHARWMLAHGTTTFEGKSGYGLDRDTELASLRAIRDAGGIPTWLGAHAVPPEFENADAYLDFALAEVLPDAAQIAEAAD